MFRDTYRRACGRAEPDPALLARTLEKMERRERPRAFPARRAAALASLAAVTAVSLLAFRWAAPRPASFSAAPAAVSAASSASSAAAARADSPSSQAAAKALPEPESSVSSQVSPADGAASSEVSEKAASPEKAAPDAASSGTSSPAENALGATLSDTAASVIALPEALSEGSGEAGELSSAFESGLLSFSCRSAGAVLSGSSQNAVYSPLSLYLSLSLLSESAGGSTRDQILSALSMPSQDLVRAETGTLFRKLSFQGEDGSLSLASSLWLDRGVSFRKDFLQRAAREYFAQSYTVDFSHPEAAASAMAGWVSENTGGLLGGDPGSLAAEPHQVLSLLNTVSLRALWTEEFPSSGTGKAAFSAQGKTVRADFMTRTESGPYYSGNGCSAAWVSFRTGGGMAFLLPDQGSSPQSLLQSPEKLKEVFSALSGGSAESASVTLSVPKFHVSSGLDLTDSLKKLGIADAFSGKADFSSLLPTGAQRVSLSGVRQQAVISVDEKGCEAAALTKADLAGAAAPPDVSRTLTLDRPFLFAVLSDDDEPLFLGIVADPTA